MTKFIATIEKLTTWVSANLTLLILVVMLAGLANSYFFGGINFDLRICAIASFSMIYPMFINLRIEDIAEIKNYHIPIALSVFLNFILSPLFAYGLGWLLLADEPFLRLGFILIALLPTSGMTATWTERAKGNLKVALSIIATSLVIIILILPVILPLVAGDLLDAGPWFIFQRILLVIIIPLILGDLTRRGIIKHKGQEYYKSKKPLFSGLSATGLLLVLFLIMSLNANTLLIENPWLTVRVFLP